MANYDYVGYCNMLADERRLNAYIEALSKVVSNKTVVLDLGAGTGIISFIAARLGARKVHSIETNPIIALAEALAVSNGLEATIAFVNDSSTSVELPEKADVLVADLHGTLPFYGTSLKTIIDARERLLKPDCRMIPFAEKVYFGIANCPEFYNDGVAVNAQDFAGFDMSSARHLVSDRLLNAYKRDLELLSGPQLFAELDYKTLTETEFRSQLSFEITKSGTVHGLRAWFVSELDPEIKIDNSPESPPVVYGAPFFPFPEAVEVSEGHRIDCDIAVFEQNEGYSWSWHTKVFDRYEQQSHEFRQSTVRGMFIPPSEMLKQSEYFVPKTTNENDIDLHILNRFDSETPIGDVAETLMDAFPERFEKFEIALERVIQAVQKFGF